MVRKKCGWIADGVAVSLLALSAGCGSNNSGVAGGSDSANNSLFHDSEVPECDSTINYRLEGRLAGKDIAIAQIQVADLESRAFTILVADNGNVRTDLALTWSDPLTADKPITLTGTSLRVPDDQPLAGQSFCVTAGDFGSATPSDPSHGRSLLFRLLGMRSGDCSGMVVDSTLKGCVWRSPTATFPAG